MLKDLTKKNSAAVAADAGRPRVRRPRVGADRRPQRARDGRGLRDDQDNVTDTDLCFGDIKTDGTDVNCIKEPASRSSAPSALGAGRALAPRLRRQDTRPGTGIFGIVRWKVKTGKPAFSADPADWNKGQFLTDIDTPGKGVLDAEVSPDGKQLALVSNLGSSSFRLWLADDPEDFALLERQADRRARLQGHLARRLQGADGRPGRRDLPRGRRERRARRPRRRVRDQKELNAAGDDPSFQPLTHRRLSGVLCPSCRRQLERGASYCGSCGTPLNGAVGAAGAGAG